MAVPILFDEVLFDPELIRAETGQRFPISGSPEFANTVLPNPKTGISKTNVNRFDAIRKITLMVHLADVQDSEYFNEFWLGGYGSGVGFRFRYQPDYTATLEAIAGPGGTQIPNGVLTTFKLYKTYTRPGVTARQDVRRIVKPVHVGASATGYALTEPDGAATRVIPSGEEFKVYFNTGGGDALQASGWSVNVTTGIITFSSAPVTGTFIKWSGSFDTPVAFEGNAYTHNFDTPSEIQGVSLREILPAELGIAY